MTTTTITNYILIRFRDHGLDFFESMALATGVFVAFLIIIKMIVTKVKKRIQEKFNKFKSALESWVK